MIRENPRPRPGRRGKVFLAKPAAQEALEQWYGQFAFGDGREEQYPIEELRRDCNLVRFAPKLSDEYSDD